MEVSRFRHNCTGCIFLGYDEKHKSDLYYHEAFQHISLPGDVTAVTLLMRHGNDPSNVDMTMFCINLNKRPIITPKFIEVFNRTIKIIREEKELEK